MQFIRSKRECTKIVSPQSYEGLTSISIVLMIVSLFQSLKYQMKIPEVDINQRFDNLGALLLSFLNVYGQQIDIDRTDIFPNMPTTEVSNPFTERVYDYMCPPQRGLRIFDPKNKLKVLQHFGRSSKLKKILVFAYFHCLGMCDCLNWHTGEYYPLSEHVKNWTEDESRTKANARYILPRLFSIQEQFFGV